jgi:Pre-mRNA splicing Prp18-interacting factor
VRQEKAVTKSKYEEDVLVNNHTAVWGSWYDRSAHLWGYSCCHQSIKNTVCTGEAGKAARAASLMDGAQRAMLAPAPLSARTDAKPVTSVSADLYGEVLDPELDPKKLKAAKERVRETGLPVDDTDCCFSCCCYFPAVVTFLLLLLSCCCYFPAVVTFLLLLLLLLLLCYCCCVIVVVLVFLLLLLLALLFALCVLPLFRVGYFP